MDVFPLAYCISISLKLFALFAPPLALTAFLNGTAEYGAARKRRTAHKASVAVFVVGSLLFFWGQELFDVFGLTLDAFRIGAGALLFLTAVSMMRSSGQSMPGGAQDDDISVVPLAIPIVMGPASIGALMVLGAEPASRSGRLAGILGLLAATAGLWILFLLAEKIQKILGHVGLSILSKMTGLLLSAIAAQLVFDGIKSFMRS
ncbi:MAG: MarC family protein [Deltaproteobacteria bacterium]|jgi:multiple antibiotic resistance protein|nr:MarC family protein [Deltaproteobacteria bacterium]